jgi:glycerol-3-phosphate cytidylyltransferase
MIRIGYAPGAFDLFHSGHLNLLRRAKEHWDYLIAGVMADEVLIQHKGVTPVIPLA